MKRLLVSAVASLLPLAGCHSKPEQPRFEDLNRQPTVRAAPGIFPAPDPATLSSITGSVLLKGTPPKPLTLDVTMDPGCVIPGAPPPLAEQYAVKDGKLANVFVYVKSGPAPAMNIPNNFTDRVVLDQKGCVYTPHVVAIMRGGYIEFRNSDPAMHTIDILPTVIGNRKTHLAQGPNTEAKDMQFPEAETMIPVRCSLHPWMNAFINVSASPFFDVTDAEGHFNLAGLPPGDYTLGAVHEVLGEQVIHLVVKQKSTSHQTITFQVP